LYQLLARIKLPEAITVYRNNQVETYDWQTFILTLGIIGGGFWLGLTTKVGEKKGLADIGYMLRLQAKVCGWIIAIGATLAAIHLLLILLGWVPP
jgi:hypothetical protein